MINRCDIFAQHPDVACRTVDGRTVAIYSPHPALLTFNETATMIWNLLDGRTSVQAILTRLAERYPMSPAEQREQEALAFLQQLVGAGMIIRQPERMP